MKGIKSFVRRNSRMTSGNKKQINTHEGLLLENLSDVSFSGFVGLEIGFGMGDSLLDIAEKHPEQLWMGIEVYEKGIASVIRQAKEKNLNNVRVMIGDSHEIIDQSIPDASIDHVRIFFPDPWPKKRHHKRRLVSKLFLDKLARIVKKEGIIHIATDHYPYAEQCYELIESHSLFSLSSQTPERPMTKFAKKAIDEGSEIADIVLVKD